MKIVVQKLARQDLLEASPWYELKVPALGKDFLEEVKLDFGHFFSGYELFCESGSIF